MIIIEFSRVNNRISVYIGKKLSQTYSTNVEVVNLQCLNLIKRYFSETIKDMCKARINTLNHTVYRTDLDGRKEFFMKLQACIENALKYPTWQNYLATSLKNLRLYAPHEGSRFQPNYIAKIDDLEKTLQHYAKTEKYYKEKNEQIILNLFDNQIVANNHEI